MLETDTTGWMFFSHAERWSLMAVGEMTLVMVKGPAHLCPVSSWVSRTTPGCVTCHTRHASVTHFRPISGNIVEVTLMTSPNLYINSHAKGTGFPLVRITIMIPL